MKHFLMNFFLIIGKYSSIMNLFVVFAVFYGLFAFPMNNINQNLVEKNEYEQVENNDNINQQHLNIYIGQQNQNKEELEDDCI